MKEKALVFSLVLLLLFGVLFIPKVNKDYFLLWNANSVKVTAESPLVSKNVKIELGISVNTINRANDLDLFKNRNKYTVIYDGEEKSKVFNEYGENDFLVTYGDGYYLSFRQFKFNRRHQHDYSFSFYPMNNGVVVKIAIDGKDGMLFERPMIRIDSASFYRCNVLTKKAGTYYNMVELK